MRLLEGSPTVAQEAAYIASEALEGLELAQQEGALGDHFPLFSLAVRTRPSSPLLDSQFVRIIDRAVLNTNVFRHLKGGIQERDDDGRPFDEHDSETVLRVILKTLMQKKPFFLFDPLFSDRNAVIPSRLRGYGIQREVGSEEGKLTAHYSLVRTPQTSQNT